MNVFKTNKTQQSGHFGT